MLPLLLGWCQSQTCSAISKTKFTASRLLSSGANIPRMPPLVQAVACWCRLLARCESIAETQPQLPSGLAEIVSYYFQYFREALRHHRQSEIITVATLVAHLVFVALMMNVDWSGRLLKVPAIGLAEILSITMKIVPIGSLRWPTPLKSNSAPLLIVTPLATTLSDFAVLLFKLNL